MNKKYSGLKLTATTLALLLLIQVPTTFADTLGDLKTEKAKIEQQQQQLNQSINKKTSEITTIESKQEQLLKQINELNTEIEKTNKEINSVITEINKANEEITKLQNDIEELQKKIDQRDELLRERARAIQSGGSVSYIDVLLGANSFVDFIDRFSAVNALLEADRQIMREQKTDRKKLEENKALVENKKKQLEEKYASLDKLKQSLDAQKTQKNKLIDELEAEQEKLKAEKQLLENEYSEALNISEDIQKQIIAEQNRIAEVARQQEIARKKEAERQRQLQQKASAGAGTSTANLPAVSAGTWTSPTNGRFTSGYGWRNIGAGPEFHYGVDVANSTGTPIVAAADGVVAYAAPLSSYGNVVIVTHSIEGHIFTTVYAHLSGFNVSVGSVVGKGQKIASMGSTGRSTGPHLHFEIHNGTWQGQSVGSINPLRYVSF